MNTRQYTTSDRLKEIMKERNLKQVDILNMSKRFQEKFDIKLSKSHLSQYVTGKSKPDQHKIYLLAKTLDVSEPWLMGYEVEMDPAKLAKSIDEENVSKFENPATTLYKYFPVSVSAGALQNVEGIMDYEEIPVSDRLLGKYAGNKHIILLKVNGESMNKIIPNESIIVVDSSKKCVLDIKTNDIVVFADNYHYSVKRFINDESNKRFIFKPESYDNTFTDIIVDYENSENLQLIGKVIKYIVDVD